MYIYDIYIMEFSGARNTSSLDRRLGALLNVAPKRSPKRVTKAVSSYQGGKMQMIAKQLKEENEQQLRSKIKHFEFRLKMIKRLRGDHATKTRAELKEKLKHAKQQLKQIQRDAKQRLKQIQRYAKQQPQPRLETFIAKYDPCQLANPPANEMKSIQKKFTKREIRTMLTQQCLAKKEQYKLPCRVSRHAPPFCRNVSELKPPKRTKRKPPQKRVPKQPIIQQGPFYRAMQKSNVQNGPFYKAMQKLER